MLIKIVLKPPMAGSKHFKTRHGICQLCLQCKSLSANKSSVESFKAKFQELTSLASTKYSTVTRHASIGICYLEKHWQLDMRSLPKLLKSLKAFFLQPIFLGILGCHCYRKITVYPPDHHHFHQKKPLMGSQGPLQQSIG